LELLRLLALLLDARAQGVLGQHPVVDVGAGAVPPGRLPALVARRHRPGEHPPVAARAVAYPELDVEFAARTNTAFPFGEHRAKVVAVDQPAQAEKSAAGAERSPGELVPAAI